MRYEVLTSGLPENLHSMIVDAPDYRTAVLLAGILIGKALKRRGGHYDPAGFTVISVLPTDKPPKYQHTEPFIKPVTDSEAGFGGQDITYERKPCPLSSRFPKHIPGILAGCTCEVTT